MCAHFGIFNCSERVAVKIEMLLVTFGRSDHCFFKYKPHLGLGHENLGLYMDNRQLQYNAMLWKVSTLEKEREEYSKGWEMSKGRIGKSRERSRI